MIVWRSIETDRRVSSRRVFMTVLMVCAVFVIGAVLVAGVCLKGQALTTDFTRKNIAPCIQYPFGTRLDGP